MNNKVEQGIIKERARKLIKLSQELEVQYMQNFIGKEVEVLVEECVDGYCYGHTGNYLHVKIKGEFQQNQMVKVLLEKVEYPYCTAQID